MSAIKALSDKFRQIIQGIAGVNTFHVGYIEELASGVTVFDAVLLLPSKAQIPTPRNWSSRTFDVNYTIMRIDRGLSGGEMTSEERETAWGELDNINRLIVLGLMDTPSQFKIVGGIAIDYGGAVNILPDKVIAINVQFKIEVYDC